MPKGEHDARYEQGQGPSSKTATFVAYLVSTALSLIIMKHAVAPLIHHTPVDPQAALRAAAVLSMSTWSIWKVSAAYPTSVFGRAIDALREQVFDTETNPFTEAVMCILRHHALAPDAREVSNAHPTVVL